MKKYTFIGLVYPERISFTLKGLTNRYKKIEIGNPGLLIRNGFFDIEIDNCKAKITFESEQIINQTSNPNIETLKNFIERICRTFIDTYCFVHSYSYDISIDKVNCQEIGLNYTFPVKGEFNFEANKKDFQRFLDIILIKPCPILGDSFSDFRKAIKYPDVTAYHCLRAIESLRRAYFDNEVIEEDNKRDKDGWKNMSEILKVYPDSTFYKIQKFAKPNRHGVYPVITYSEREEMMKFTRKVINAFIDWISKK
jgi:hypothetical protein